jgi:TolB-like protein/DNA-binding winged helix-turn-helix (wHTH) protein/Tfp pilus assembly protein PilF
MGNGVKQLREFGPFRVDPDQRLLLRDEQPVSLSPKAFDLLLVLLEHSGQIVLKDDLMKTLWPDTFVEESNLGQHIFQLRKALGDRSQDSSYIVTVPGRGYRFAQKVRTIVEDTIAEETIAEEESIVVESHTRSRLLIDGEGSPRPARRPRNRPLRSIAVWLGLVVIVFVGYWAWRRSHLEKPAGPGRVMLAVLPFQNLTGDPEQEYFADGLTEEMITQLGRLRHEQLGVIARTSVMGYKHGDKRLDQIGRELSVQYVLEGSFRRAGDRLRITAQLIQVKDQTHLWARDYDRRPQDILTVQDEVAVAVAEEIQLRLTPQQRTDLAHARTVDPDAYEAYLKGRYFWNKRTEDGFRRAIEYFNQAIAKDPNYAQAYAGLADAYVLLGGYSFIAQEDAMPKAKAAAQKAIAIDGQLADAYASLGMVSEQWDWNFTAAENDYKQAIKLDPNYSVAHHWYGDGYLAFVGRMDEAIAELRKAHELDPLSPIIATDLAKRLCDDHRYDEGVALFRRTLEVDPDFVEAHRYLAQAYARMGRYPDAIAEVQKIKSWERLDFAMGQVGQIYALQGRRQQAQEIAYKLRLRSAQEHTEPIYPAKIDALLGEKDLAFVWLEKAYKERSPAMLALNTDPDYDPLRSDPRFQRLIRLVSLP